MNSVFGSIRAEGTLDRVDQAVRVFEDERRYVGSADIEGHWRGIDPAEAGDVAVLAALIKSDLRNRFVRGESPAVADYIERFPELRGADSRILSLIYEEYCLREERGERIGVESFCDRYPDWKDSLASQLQYHRLISQAAGLGSVTPKFPQPGEFFGEFALVSILGTGGSSRVFLARDTSLGDRMVVLKVAVDRGNEPMILGRLVHPRIVWVNSVSYQPESQLRGLSMPYHPGLPLDEIVKGFVPSAFPRRARIFWEVLVADRGANPPPISAEEGPDSPADATRSLERGIPDGDGWKGFPIRGSYPQGVAWIGKVLAEALHHAHGKQTFHRDIKPGNVLMTLSQGPQLLDFNLAESPHSAERADDALHGGTLPYMAPEQIRAFLDPKRWEQVGAQADIYSLGLVLRELLTGRLPDLPDETLPRSRALADFLDRRACLDRSIRHLNPSVPSALEAIVARCLAFEPESRYPDALSLAVDLERFLQLRPLMLASNPCRRERVENHLIRKRRFVELLIAGSIGVATLLTSLPVEHSPAFTSAVNAYARNQFDQAIEPLENLAVKYPESPLPELFLGLARFKSDPVDRLPAEQYFRKAMAVPNAVPVVIDWARAHPEIGLLTRLDDFADYCLDAISAIDAAPDSPGVRSQEDRASLGLLARNAYAITLAIEPDRGKFLHGLASLEESQKNFEVAYRLISRCLSKLQIHNPLEQKGEKSSLLLSRSRIALSWAVGLRARGGEKASRGAHAHLMHALADLDEGDRLGINWETHRNKSLYYRMQVSLNLAEIELELDRTDEAAPHLKQAEGALASLVNSGTVFAESREVRERLDRASKRILASSAPPHEGILAQPETSVEAFGHAERNSAHPF